MPPGTPPVRFFDPTDPVVVVERDLPHWLQAGTVCFLTWRTWDSIPRAWMTGWLSDRARWLQANGIDPFAPDWVARLHRLPADRVRAFHRSFSARWEAYLDGGLGACPLRRPDLARVVGESLRHFDGDRYALTDFVVMPNHVHVLAAFPDERAMLAQCESWKHYTAREINRSLGRSGRFWQADGFDHLVRDEHHFAKVRAYIAENPRRAGLMPGEYLHYSRDWSPGQAAFDGHSRSE